MSCTIWKSNTWLSNGGLFSAHAWCSYTADLFVAFLSLLRQHVDKPLTVIPDNARIHTALGIQPHLKLLKDQGVTLYLLGPYSPVLSRWTRFSISRQFEEWVGVRVSQGV